MKVLKRVFAIAISLSVICAAATAFAADATYDADKATIALASEDIQKIESMEGQVTMAVVPKQFGSGSNSEDIYYINQGIAAEMADVAAEIGLKDKLNVPASYQVRVGGKDTTMAVYNIPAIKFEGSAPADITAEGRVGVVGTLTVNGGVQSIKVLLEDAVAGLTGSYDWSDINIASANGASFTFGLEIVNNTGAELDMSGISITGVEIPSAE